MPHQAYQSAQRVQSAQRTHGGPDEHGVPQHDFSANSNACGSCPVAMQAVADADASTYPDASYTRLRQQLAGFHGVAVQRVVLAASASEFIFRITAMAKQRGVKVVSLPPHSYGDYAQAANAHHLSVLADSTRACLHWSCEPASPLGGTHEGLNALVDKAASSPNPGMVVLDRAYEPLRLSGAPTLDANELQKVWQLWTPNKALGLTGVRAAYAIAPQGAEADIEAMNQLCPSWPIGVHGVALLQAWTQPDAQAWLAGSLDTLRVWKARQLDVCGALGWTCEASLANFFCAKPLLPQGLGLQQVLAALRLQGIKLRDAASFGLLGQVRLAVLSPTSQDALSDALKRFQTNFLQS